MKERARHKRTDKKTERDRETERQRQLDIQINLTTANLVWLFNLIKQGMLDKLKFY